MHTHLPPLQYYRFNELCREAVDEYVSKHGNAVPTERTVDTLIEVLKRHFPSTGEVSKAQAVAMMSEGTGIRDYLMWWGHGKNIFVFTPELVEAFGRTDVEDIPTNILRAPFPSFYLKFGHRTEIQTVPGKDRFLDGAYIHEFRHGLTVNYTQCSTDCQIGSTGLGFYLDLVSTNTVGEALVSGIRVTEELNKEKTEEAKQHGTAYDLMLDTEPDRLALRDHGIPIFREVTKLVVNCLAFILFERDSIREDWMGAPKSMIEKLKRSSTPKEQLRNTSKLLTQGFTKIQLCDARIDSEHRDETRGDVRQHWRRGHWRRQPWGPGLSQIRLKWIHPTVVRADKGQPEHGHIYQGGDTPEA